MGSYLASFIVMDLRQLNLLLAVAEHHSFSGAARALHTVQSNVSTHVARLERELKTVLIDRRTMAPTAEGEAVIERAQRIRSELRAITDDISSMKNEVAGSVNIGCIGTVARWIANPLLNQLSDEYPSLRPIITDDVTSSLIPKLITGELDIAIVNSPISSSGVNTLPLFEEEYVIIASKDHPLSKKDAIKLQDLSDLEIMLTPTGTAIRDNIDQEAAAAGVALMPVAEITGLRLLASLAMEGETPALLPASAASGHPKGNWIVVPVEGLSKRKVGLAFNQRMTPSTPVRLTIDVLTQIVSKNAPNQPGIRVTLD